MTRVRLDLSSFGVAKAGYRPDEWEDSAAHSVRRGRFAVADGATTAFRRSPASHLLTSGWIADPFDLHDDDAWSRWFATRVEAWSADLAARDGDVPFYEVAAAERGSFATLLGVALEVVDGNCRWHALAVGDACLFHVRAGELLTAFPLDDPDRFGSHPELVHTAADPERSLAGVKRSTGSVRPDDHLFLATDALAEWVLRSAPDADDLWETLAEIDEGGFERLVGDARRDRRLQNDDVTLLRCRVSDGGFPMIDAERWPDAGEYAQAARDPGRFLLDPSMRNGRLRTSPLGIPLPATGRNAAVFRLSLDDHDVAVRCFTRQPSDGRRRYDALRAYVERQAIPSFADARWIPDAVAVDDRTLPMICMEWIDGLTLDRYVERHLDDGDALRDLATRWVDLLFALEASDVAHGDLQHGNILVEPDGQVRLVDLDGVWTPATTDLEPKEVGHRNYQHPQRIAEGYWGRSVDAFSALAIAVSLEAVAQRPGLWHAHNDGANNLLLADPDFRDPEDTPVWQELATLEEPVPTLTRRLAEACRSEVARLRTPTELVRGSGPVTTKAPPRYLVERLHRETPPDPAESAADVPVDRLPPTSSPEPGVPRPSPVSGPPAESEPAVLAGSQREPGSALPRRPGVDSAVLFVLVATVLAVVLVTVGIAVLGVATPATGPLGAVASGLSDAGGWAR